MKSGSQPRETRGNYKERRNNEKQNLKNKRTDHGGAVHLGKFFFLDEFSFKKNRKR